MSDNGTKEIITEAFKDYDKKLLQLANITKILSDYCENKTGDYEFQEQCEHYEKMEEIQKQLEAHWEATKEEREKTHTGKMYEKYMREKG